MPLLTWQLLYLVTILWQVFGRCYVVLDWNILNDTLCISFMCLFLFNMFICLFFLNWGHLYAICTTNATDRHLLYAPWDTDVLSSVQMIATTCVVALWLSIEWLINHTNLKKYFILQSDNTRVVLEEMLSYWIDFLTHLISYFN